MSTTNIDQLNSEKEKRDEHTGVGSIPTPVGEYPYTYEHVNECSKPPADVYRIEAQIRFVDRPIHKNVYYVPSEALDFALMGYEQTGEEIIDIRPISVEEANDEMEWYRGGDA